MHCLGLSNSLHNTLRSSCNLYESVKVVSDLLVIKVGLGEFSRAHLDPPGPSGQEQWSALLPLLVVTCVNSFYKSSALKIHNLSQPLLGNVKTRRQSLSHAGKYESFSNERESNHSCGNLEFKLTGYQPETHEECIYQMIHRDLQTFQVSFVGSIES